LLLLEHGPLDCGGIRELLPAGVVLPDRILVRLPDSHPEAFERCEDDRIAVAGWDPAVPEATVEMDEEAEPDVLWWDRAAPNSRLVPEALLAVAVSVIHASNLSSHVLTWAPCGVAGGESLAVDFASSDSVAEARDALAHAAHGYEALVGWRGDGLLGAVLGARGEMDDAHVPALLDLQLLAALVDPAMSAGSLEELLVLRGIAGSEDRGADASAAVAALTGLLADVEDGWAGWPLVRVLLEEADEALARVLPEGQPGGDMMRLLTAAPDPLLVAGPGEPPSNVRVETRRRLEALRASRTGMVSRPSQDQMAKAIADVLDKGGRLAVEAPTGTGKSLAYLVPAAIRAERSNRPVVIATHTKVLQHQLSTEALRLKKAGLLEAPVRQISGIANYVCAREVVSVINDQGAADAGWLAVALGIRVLAVTPRGLWENAGDTFLRGARKGYGPTRLDLTTTSAACARESCDQADVCPAVAVMRGAQGRPGVFIINHALLGRWSEVLEDGGTGVAAKALEGDLIIDEAHELEDSLTSAWTDEVGAAELLRLHALVWGRHGVVRLVRRALGRRMDHEAASVLAEVRNLERVIRDDGAQIATNALAYIEEFARRAGEVDLRRGVVGRRSEYRQLASAAGAVAARLGFLQAKLITLGGFVENGGLAARRIDVAVNSMGAIKELLGCLVELPDGHLWVHLLGASREPSAHGWPNQWSYRRVPIEVGARFATQVVDRARSTVLTSGTLLVDGDFHFIGSRLGVEVAETPDGFDLVSLPSPFDYATQSRVVLTSHLPLPIPSQEDEFCEEVVRDQVGFLSLTHGRALELFASRSRLERIAAGMHEYDDALSERGVELLVQGEHGPGEISARFKERNGAVALGLRSYWTGFDAPGETLSYLIIEKPPYPHPDDPIVAARQRAVTEAGGDAFLDYAVPRTAITFAQGFGRLVRTETDRGAALILDRRMQVPTSAQAVMLRTLPGPDIQYADSREDAWRLAIEFVEGAPPDMSEALVPPRSAIEELLLELRASTDAPGDLLRRAAFLLFGISDLAPWQLEAMEAVLAGRDVLGIQPTGAGKSLVFQLPALISPDDRAAIVVSPLISLIKDQVDDLRSRRGLREVRGITQRTSATEQTEILRDLAEGRVRLLYVSPERLAHNTPLHGVLARSDLAALVVDEAHCISSWGHDFRPEFRRVAPSLMAMRRAPRCAVTATATPKVEEDIKSALHMEDPLVLRGDSDRPNLEFAAVQCSDEAHRTREFLRVMTYLGTGPGIVYASRRATTEEVAWLLRQAGYSARAYHAGLLPEQREAIQEDFLEGSTSIVVATKAFGMGINKPDIEWVIHYDIPESLESFVQETGRAARALDSGRCILLFTGNDMRRRRKLLSKAPLGFSLDEVRKALDAVHDSPMRGDVHLVDPEALCEAVGCEEEDLNLLIAWLEQVGTVRREINCIKRMHITLGAREPDDQEERGRFRRLFKQQLRAAAGARRFIDVVDFCEIAEEDPDAFERSLSEWMVRRLITYGVTQRYWRVRELAPFDEVAFASRLRDWGRWRQSSFDAMAQWADTVDCRRAVTSLHFGQAPRACAEIPEARPCDRCSADPHPWLAIPPERVPDAESLVSVDVVVLQAVAWTSRLRNGSFSETGLRRALLGHEAHANGTPLGRGLLGCPQFGAVRHVRASERRLSETIERLVSEGAFERLQVTSSQGREYASLAITPRGTAALSGVGTA
jgi:ATP-dependent DNA helicase RecQ